MKDATIRIKTLRYQIMLALYLPILLYAFSTFDIDSSTPYFQSIESLVVGQDNMILGQTHEAGAYLAAAPTEYDIRVDDERLSVEEIEDSDGVTRSVIQMDTGGLLEEGEDQAEIEYSATLVYKNVEEQEVEEEVQGSFVVNRPQVLAQTVAADALYSNVRNEVRIQVPGLENEPLRLESGGQSTEGTDRTLTLSPSGDQESVEVSAYLMREEEEDVSLGSQSFGIITPPNPTVSLAQADGPTLEAGESLQGTGRVEIEVEPDPEFESRYSDDANYFVDDVEVSYQEGIGYRDFDANEYTLDPSTGVLDMTNGLNNRGISPGTPIRIRITGMYRQNHAGQAIRDEIELSRLTSSFNIRL
ncbi:MAG: GldM family protein [Longimonas sp.]|uniref:hypothetical protein n=1 Tax=Longimonas sp. TaxID=2039626 RepID=UPI0039768C48